MPKQANVTKQRSSSVNPGSCVQRSSDLLRAVLIEDEADVKKRLKQLDYWHDLHKFDHQNRNPLLEAIKKENLPIVNLIASHPKLLAGVYKDRVGNTPFHYIDKVKSGFKRKLLAQALIAKGMRIDLTNDAGKKPTHHKEYLKIQQKLAEQRQVIEGRWSNRLLNALLIPAETALKYTGTALLATLGLIVFAGMMNSIVAMLLPAACLGYWYTCTELGSKAPGVRQLQIEQLERDFLDQVKRGKLTANKLDIYLKQGLDLRRDLRKDEYALGILGEKITTKASEYHLLDFAKDCGSKASVELIEHALQSSKAPAITPGYKDMLRKTTSTPTTPVVAEAKRNTRRPGFATNP